MIAGADISSRAIDIVLLDDEGDLATYYRFELVGDTPFERARSVASCLPSERWWQAPLRPVWLLGIEDPRGPYAHSIKAVACVLGAFLATLPPRLTIVSTMAQEWKRLSVGRPGAGKGEVAAWARERWPAAGPDLPQDAYDAYAIAWAVRRLNAEAIEAGP